MIVLCVRAFCLFVVLWRRKGRDELRFVYILFVCHPFIYLNASACDFHLNKCIQAHTFTTKQTDTQCLQYGSCIFGCLLMIPFNATCRIIFAFNSFRAVDASLCRCLHLPTVQCSCSTRWFTFVLTLLFYLSSARRHHSQMLFSSLSLLWQRIFLHT